MPRVLEINNIDELGHYRLAWNSLLSQTRSPSFFQSLDWLESYWRHFGEGQRLRVLIVLDGHRPIGILPLTVRRERTRAGSVRTLTYPLHDWGAFYGPIGPQPALTLLAGLQHVRDSARDWDVLDLRWTDADGADAGRTSQAMRLAGFSTSKAAWMHSAQVDLTIGWDAYWASRKSHWRTNVRGAEKKLRERGELTLLRYRPQGCASDDGDPRWDLYDTCERLAHNSWQGSSNNGTTLSHGEVRLFFRETHARAAAIGALDLNLLMLDGEAIAYAYNYHYQGCVSGLRMGFDRALACEGAGTVLHYLSLQDSVQRGDHTYDMGGEYLNCKRYWHTGLRSSYRLTHYPALAPRAQLLRLKRWTKSLSAAG